MAKKKPNFGPGFGLLSPNLSPEKLFVGFTSTTLSQTIQNKTYDPNSRK